MMYDRDELLHALAQHYKDTTGDARETPATITAHETMMALHRIIECRRNDSPKLVDTARQPGGGEADHG